MEAKGKIIVDLDVPSLEEALKLVEKLHPYVGYFKVGLELLTIEGAPKVVQAIKETGGRIFFDGKFKDIPNTIAGVTRAVISLGVDMFNVHCLGGAAMMKAARQSAEETAKAKNMPRPLILGVTILTSLDFNDLIQLGFWEEINITDPNELVVIKRQWMEWLVSRQLAWLAQESGLDGVIASPQEIKAIRKYTQSEFLVVTPDVRPEWAAAGDQKRIITPFDAIKAGASYLIIGRPITKPSTEIAGPVEAAKKVAEEIAAAM